jgi:hypothetical protein
MVFTAVLNLTLIPNDDEKFARTMHKPGVTILTLMSYLPKLIKVFELSESKLIIKKSAMLEYVFNQSYVSNESFDKMFTKVLLVLLI